MKLIAICIVTLFAGAAVSAAPASFATPRDAAQALIDAAGKNDTSAMLKLFGPGGKDIVQSGDPAQDQQHRADFARRAGEKLVIEMDSPDAARATIVVGNDDWPFPVPLVRKNGRWSFDPAAGRMEILARRIGRNELAAIDVCRGYVEAQMEYAARDRQASGVLQYAQKIVSSSGKQDGLYWSGEADNFVPKAFADAAAAMVAKPEPYHGYYFRILKAQGADAQGGAADYIVKGKMIGGFALVAWPAEYGVSGVKTLIVNHAGVVYERDLGPGTAAAARAMLRFDPGKGWKAVEGE